MGGCRGLVAVGVGVGWPSPPRAVRAGILWEGAVERSVLSGWG